MWSILFFSVSSCSVSLNEPEEVWNNQKALNNCSHICRQPENIILYNYMSYFWYKSVDNTTKVPGWELQWCPILIHSSFTHFRRANQQNHSNFRKWKLGYSCLVVTIIQVHALLWFLVNLLWSIGWGLISQDLCFMLCADMKIIMAFSCVLLHHNDMN